MVELNYDKWLGHVAFVGGLAFSLDKKKVLLTSHNRRYNYAAIGSYPYEEDDYIPAPTMAELWRELPTIPYLRKCCGRTEAWYNDNENVFSNANPADALAELLILVKEQNK